MFPNEFFAPQFFAPRYFQRPSTSDEIIAGGRRLGENVPSAMGRVEMNSSAGARVRVGEVANGRVKRG